MNKKIVKVICLGSVLAASATIVAISLTTTNKNKKNITTVSPHDSKYKRYEIYNDLNNNKDLVDLSSIIYADNAYQMIINKNNFDNNFKTIFKKTLEKNDVFKNEANSFKINEEHLFKNDKEVNVDVTWETNKNFYYDQFDIVTTTSS